MRKLMKSTIAFALIGCMCLNVHATSVTDLEQEKTEAEEKKKEVETAIANLQNAQEDTMASIVELDELVEEYNTEIAAIQLRQESLAADIENKKNELEQAKLEQTAKYEDMKLHIQCMYESGSKNYLGSLITSGDLSDVVNQTEYISAIYKYDDNMLQEYLLLEWSISQEEIELESAYSEAEELEAQLQEDLAATQELLDAKAAQLEVYADSMTNYQNMMAAYQADIDATDKKIADALTASDYTNTDNTIPATAPSGSNSSDADSSDEGTSPNGDSTTTSSKLLWPVSTGGTITSTFGPRWGTIHNGLDIACPVGTDIYACESGKVLLSQYSASAGYWIIIDHGNGMSTVYMHNSQLLVKAGDIVTRGQVIAKSGNTGNSTGPHCHLGVQINGTYVDPYPYLR
ncbi:MAG: murein hydrolase activator EnvC family protein [Wujia sp.]